MALNPEKVADILFLELNRHWNDRLYSTTSNRNAIEICNKAMARETTPKGFVDWLFMQGWFQLREGIDQYDYEFRLIEEMQKAWVIAESLEILRTREHKILFIESLKSQSRSFEDLTKTVAKIDLSIKPENIVFTHLAYPPQEPNEFVQLLTEHTGSVLHNLSLGDLITIRDAIQVDNSLAKKLVVVETGMMKSMEQNQLYSELHNMGVFVTEKPFPSFDEVIYWALGAV